MKFSQIVSEISFDTFKEVMNQSPRKVRESLFSHYGVKTKSRGLLTALKDKKDGKIKNLHKALEKATSDKEQEFLKELFRNWLLHQRPLLKATLDFLDIKNDDGLVETELDFFKDLKQDKIKALVDHVSPNFPRDAVLIYFAFVEIPEFEKYLD